MATCPRCHTTLTDDAHVCNACGALIDASSPADAVLPIRPSDTAASDPPGSVAPSDDFTEAPKTQAALLDGTSDREDVINGRSPVVYSTAPPPVPAPPASPLPTVVRAQSEQEPLLGQRRQWLLLLVTLGALGIVLLFACIGLGYLFFNARNATIFSQLAPSATPAITRTPRPTAVAQVGSAATPTLSGNILLHDTFSRTNAPGLVGEDDEVRYAFEDGGYAITVKVEQLGVWRKFTPTYTNIAAQVATTLVDGPDTAAAALIFRYQDNKNFYIFNVTDNGQYNLEMRKNDSMTTLIDWTSSSAIKNKGETNVLRVETVDSTITLYVNDTKLETTKDATFNKGQIAIAVNTFDQGNAKIRFNDLIVEEQ